MILALALAFATNIEMPGERLLVTLPHAHDAATARQVIWSEEPLIATITLDVWDLPGEPLREIARTDQWHDAVSLTLTSRRSKSALPKVFVREARLRSSPPVISLQATYTFGMLAAGDYELQVRAGRSLRTLAVRVRSGSEPEWRDLYLRDKADKTNDYRTFRALELERFARDPTRTDAAHKLLDRSLNEGSEAEIRQDIDRVIKANGRPIKPVKQPYLHSLLLAQASVPELVAHRPDWMMYFDSSEMAFVIYSRSRHIVLRTFR